MTNRKPDLPEGDDGRTIVDMNVEGMPWYTPGGAGPRRFRRRAEGEPVAQESLRPYMSRRESRYYTWGALKAALLVAGVMSAGLVLFILFCQLVWFK